MNNKSQGVLIILSGPAGAGKTTYAKMLCDRLDDCVMSISATTRLPRGNEAHGKDYFFLNEDEFKQQIAEDKFAEYAKFSRNYYGTPKLFIDKNLSAGKNTILDIEVKGASQIKKTYNRAVMIFLLPPTPEILIERLRKRKTESNEEVSRRMDIARDEITKVNEYDYFLINDNLEKTYSLIESIVKADKYRIRGGEIDCWLGGRKSEDVLRIQD